MTYSISENTDGPNFYGSKKRIDVQGAGERHHSGDGRAPAYPSVGLSIPASRERFARTSGSRVLVPPEGDLCEWVFLAPPSLSIRKGNTEVANGFLASETRKKSREGYRKPAPTTSYGMECLGDLGVPDEEFEFIGSNGGPLSRSATNNEVSSTVSIGERT